MTSRRLLNANALVALTLGLVLLLNGLLGPRFPFGAAIAAVVGVLLLVAAVFLGQGGMGKGPLTTRVQVVGRDNLAVAVLLLAYAVLGLDDAARMFVLVVAIVLAAIGAAQLRADASPERQPAASSGHRRASAEELRVAIGRTPAAPSSAPSSSSAGHEDAPPRT